MYVYTHVSEGAKEKKMRIKILTVYTEFPHLDPSCEYQLHPVVSLHRLLQDISLATPLSVPTTSPVHKAPGTEQIYVINDY